MATQAGGLAELWEAVRRHWRLAVLVALPVLLIVTVYAETLPDRYEGSAVVALNPRPGSGSADAIRLVVPKYVSYVTSDASVNTIADELGEDRTLLRQGVDASLASDTVALTVTVRLPSGERAAAAANALARAAIVYSTVDPLVQGAVVSPALAPSAPAAPRRRLYELAGLVLAVIAAVVASLLLERGRPHLLNQSELSALTGHPVVGRLPASRAMRGQPSEALADPLVGAAVRSLRTRLDIEARIQAMSVIVFTSPTAGDGKTTVATLFAQAAARLTPKVLLVDADLRLPRVHAVFGLAPEPGLVDVLRGRVRLERAVKPVKGSTGLSVLPTTADPDAGDLLAHSMPALLEKLRATYDLVVVDCPPVLAGDDARTLAINGDATVLVVSRGSGTAVVAEATDILDSLGVRVLGSVLNRSRESKQVYGSPYLRGTAGG